MKLRATPIFISLLLSVLTASGSERTPTVVGVHLSPVDLRSICIVDSTVVATTAWDGRWMVTIADLMTAVHQPSFVLTPTWMPAQPHGAAPCRETTTPAGITELDGFAVTSHARLAGEDWFGTFGGGLYRSSDGHVASSPDNVHDLAITDNTLLIAHSDGLAALDGETITPIRLSGPPVADITALEMVGDTLWIGSFDHGLAFYRTGRWETVPTTQKHGGDWINSLCWDGVTLWVGSAAGLGRWDPTVGRIVPETRVSGRVQSIRCGDGEVVVAATSAIWIGTDHGWKKIDLAGEALHTATRFHGDLWAAGLRGIVRRRGANWERDTELNGRLPDSWITALLPDGDSIWAGTYDSGLLRLDRNGNWRTAVSSAWVNPNAMVLTRTGVAVGTMGDGLLITNAAASGWQRLTTAHGLPSNDVTALRPRGDTLWVGTRAGIAEVKWLY
jgi:ligand-binding sensor domain-containing protein